MPKEEEKKMNEADPVSSILWESLRQDMFTMHN